MVKSQIKATKSNKVKASAPEKTNSHEMEKQKSKGVIRGER